jgi:hypothetical protein
MTKSPSKPAKPRLPRGRRGATENINQATTEDMQREDLGIAAKE